MVVTDNHFPVAAIVLAHADAPMTERLVEALDPMPVFLHLDSRVSPGPWMDRLDLGHGSRVHLTSRVRCRISSWSLVEAELAALSEAYATSTAEHFLVMSGSDYPLASVEGMAAELEQWRGLSRVVKIPVPFAPWGRDGGMKRFNRRWVTRNDAIVRVFGKFVYYPGRRPIPPGVSLYASQAWKILARSHVGELLRVCREHPALVKWWQTTFVPEESMVVSTLSSPALVGEAIAESVVHSPMWLIEWDMRNTNHPRTLTMGDWDIIRQAATVWPVDTPSEVDRPVRLERRRLVARKFRSVEADVLDRIDAELRA